MEGTEHLTIFYRKTLANS